MVVCSVCIISFAPLGRVRAALVRRELMRSKNCLNSAVCGPGLADLSALALVSGSSLSLPSPCLASVARSLVSPGLLGPATLLRLRVPCSPGFAQVVVSVVQILGSSLLGALRLTPLRLAGVTSSPISIMILLGRYWGGHGIGFWRPGGSLCPDPNAGD